MCRDSLPLCRYAAVPKAIEFCRNHLRPVLAATLVSASAFDVEKWKTTVQTSLLTHLTGNPSNPNRSPVSPFPQPRPRPPNDPSQPPHRRTRTISNRALLPRSAIALIPPQTPSFPSRQAQDRKCPGPPLHRTSSARGRRNSTSPGTPQKTPAAVTTVILTTKSLPLTPPNTSRQQQRQQQQISRNEPKPSAPVTSAGQKR